LNTPVVGGNVSLYNEAPEGPIYPTPVVGMVGKLPDPAVAPVNSFPREGLVVALAGRFEPSLAGSELEKLRGALSDGLPAVDLASHAQTLAVIREATRSRLVVAAHDIAEGGLAVALAEMAIPARVGVRADLRPLENASAKGGGSIAADSAPPNFSAPNFSAPAAADSRARFADGPSPASASEALLFGEGAGGFLLACAPADWDSLAAICADISFTRIGETGGSEIILQLSTASLSLQVEEAAQAYERAVPSSFE
jgi:phosphoribosylformylglycinamidine (FGAM) synthase-like enzyme